MVVMDSVPRPSLINALQYRLLHKPLPGALSHLKMAHAVRRADPHPDSSTTRDAAVLITFFEKTPGDWQLIFIRKTSSRHPDKHAGQIAFPGGKREPTDPDLMFTALREANEEVAIDLSAIDVLGPLSPLYITVSQYMVQPYVAYSWKRPELIRQESEIEEILEIPLTDFLHPAIKQDVCIRLHQGIVLNHVPSFHIHGHVIWGATAMIMSELLDILPRP